MTHLFDTNAWLRLVETPDQVSGSVRGLISTLRGPCGLSAISIWEVCFKVRKGLINFSVPLDDWLQLSLNPLYVQVIPLDAQIARLSTELPGEFHKDPADRFIVATARSRNLTIVTSDEKILSYSHVQSLDTR